MATLPPVVRVLSSSGSLGSPRAGLRGLITLPLLHDEQQRVAEEEDDDEEGEEERDGNGDDAEAGGGDNDDGADAASDAPSFSPEHGLPTIGGELRR